MTVYTLTAVLWLYNVPVLVVMSILLYIVFVISDEATPASQYKAIRGSRRA